jgi:hypothetical protein
MCLPRSLPTSSPRRRGGKSNHEIAKILVISERTARTHVSNVLSKLNLSSRTQAARMALREGLVPRALIDYVVRRD